MKPFSNFIILALALTLFLSIITPNAGALSPVINGSEYSTYRNWNDEIAGMGVLEKQYISIKDRVLENSVSVDGYLLLNQPNGPYPSSGSPSYGSEFATTADYNICWLNENFIKQSFHIDETIGFSGGQNCWGGQIIKTIYRSNYWNDDIPSYAANSIWIEDCYISINVKSPITYQYEKVATWVINSAFSELIYLVAEYSLEGPGNADYTLINDWNHPSATKTLWNRANWNGEYRATPSEYYDNSLAYDIVRNDLILAEYDYDNISSRSALYGYALSMSDRMLSVNGWQQIIDTPESTASLVKAQEYLNSAIDATSLIMSDIETMPIDDIQSSITDAITDYHLAILYTDKAVIENWADYKPIGSPGDASYYTLEEFRAVWIETYITPYITELEEPDYGFIGWVFGSTSGTILAFATVGALIYGIGLKSYYGYLAALLIGLLTLMVFISQNAAL